MKSMNSFFPLVLLVLLICGTVRAGDLDPPPNAVDAEGNPVPTMRTLNEVTPSWSQRISSGSERFKLVLNDEAVLDKETGLVWERTPVATKYTWILAVQRCMIRSIGDRKGWRLPSITELNSLMDFSTPPYDFRFPAGHPFNLLDGSDDMFWSTTSTVNNSSFAYYVSFKGDTPDNINSIDKQSEINAWCVRGRPGE